MYNFTAYNKVLKNQTLMAAVGYWASLFFPQCNKLKAIVLTIVLNKCDALGMDYIGYSNGIMKRIPLRDNVL